MKYIKASVSYKLADIPYTKMRISDGIPPYENIWVQIPPDTDHIVMSNDLLAFAPFPTAGVLLKKRFDGNVAELRAGGILEVHPEWYKLMLENKLLDKDGDYIGPYTYSFKF